MRIGKQSLFEPPEDRMFRIARPITACATACLTALLWVAQAQAHAMLVSADPPPNASVSAPKMIRLEFSTELAKRFSTLKLTDTDGNPVAVMIIDSKDPKILEAMPSAPLVSGLYTVSWTAVSTNDGHKTTGTFSFTVP